MSEAVCIYRNLHPAKAELIKAGLASAGIDVRAVGVDRAGIMGAVPVVEAEVELYVAPDDVDAARQIIESMEEGQADRPPWTCPDCGETIEGVFTECWNCSEAPVQD